MTSYNVGLSIDLAGLAKGHPSDGLLRHGVSRNLSAEFDESGTGIALANNAIDKASEAQTLTAGGTVAIDLTSFTNALLQTAQSMSIVRVIYVEHVVGSSASSITVFNAGAGNSFQGPLSAGASISLLPGDVIALVSQSTTGWVVDGTHKNFSIVNADGSNNATIRYHLSGS